jgi:hypothetical protein
LNATIRSLHFGQETLAEFSTGVFSKNPERVSRDRVAPALGVAQKKPAKMAGFAQLETKKKPAKMAGFSGPHAG